MTMLSNQGTVPVAGGQAVTLFCGQGSAGGVGRVESSGVEAGWCGALPTGNNNGSKEGTEHFHISFLTSPTTPLEGAGVGVIVMLLRALRKRESEVKDLVQRHPNSCPVLTLPFWGPWAMHLLPFWVVVGLGSRAS